MIAVLCCAVLCCGEAESLIIDDFGMHASCILELLGFVPGTQALLCTSWRLELLFGASTQSAVSCCHL